MLLEIRQKIHSGYKTNAWEDLWIPAFHVRPVMSITLVVHPRMTDSDFIKDDSEEWNVKMLENSRRHTVNSELGHKPNYTSRHLGLDC